VSSGTVLNVDVLSDVLAAARAGGAVTARVSAAAPRGISIGQEQMAAFHAVIAGACWLRRPGARPLQLAAGDLTLLPAGSPHALADPAGPLVRYEDLLDRHPGSAAAEIELPGTGPHARLICGAYHYDARVSHPLVTGLPPVMHVPAGLPASCRDPAGTLRMLATELADPRPGSQTILDRLVDVLFVHVLRLRATTHDDAGRSWLAVMNNPGIAAASPSCTPARPGRGPWRNSPARPACPAPP
jgi:hypothetical protein